jgi:FixJ family two-component response regulator
MRWEPERLCQHEFLLFSRPVVLSCLVFDVRLRGKNGLTFQREIVNSGMRIPVAFMTGHGEIEMSAKAMKAGVMDFFTESFRDRDMLEAIGQALGRDKVQFKSEGMVLRLRGSYVTLTPREKKCCLTCWAACSTTRLRPRQTSVKLS